MLGPTSTLSACASFSAGEFYPPTTWGFQTSYRTAFSSLAGNGNAGLLPLPFLRSRGLSSGPGGSSDSGLGSGVHPAGPPHNSGPAAAHWVGRVRRSMAPGRLEEPFLARSGASLRGVNWGGSGGGGASVASLELALSDDVPNLCEVGELNFDARRAHTKMAARYKRVSM
jgi:hypothetical protein